MTCIIGLEHEGEVYIGADSAAVAGWDVSETLLPKVFQRGDFLVGYTTSFRMGQILEQHLDVRERHDLETETSYIISGVIEAVRKCLKAHGFAKVDNNTEEGGCFLVGYRGKLYRVNDDYGVTRHATGFDALGCGMDYALGAMAALADIEPMARLQGSLEIAAHFSGAVMAPFTILKLERPE